MDKHSSRLSGQRAPRYQPKHKAIKLNIIHRTFILVVASASIVATFGIGYLFVTRGIRNWSSVKENQQLYIEALREKEEIERQSLLKSNFLLRMSELISPPSEKKARLKEKRKKCAILMMYCGQGYYGMQRNRGFDTIESELFKALRKINLVTDEEFEFPTKILFQRASKTDKNVSALGQLCSLMLTNTNFENHVTLLNETLPPSIRILNILRMTKTFNAKGNASNRTYEYVTPSFAFAPVRENSEDTTTTVSFSPSISHWDSFRNYRIPPERLEEVNRLLQAYVGTKNYHNFTSGREATDRSCKRYMLSLECGAPFIIEDLEFVTITIVGQSFMMHQIRKMIGLVMAIARGFTPESSFQRAFSLDRMDIPKAPGLGLMLRNVNYDAYNRKFGKDGCHDPIDWTLYSEKIEEFKRNYIMKDIYQTEMTEHPMLQWLDTLVFHNYQDRDGPPRAKKEIDLVLPPLSDLPENGEAGDNEDFDDAKLVNPLITVATVDKNC